MIRPTHVFRRLFCAALLAVLLAPAAAAQSSGEGSLYARLGLGSLHQYASPQLEAMGGASTALSSLNYVNHGNPATWADQVLTRIAASAEYQALNAEDGDGATSLLTAGSFNGVHLAFPLYTRKLGVALSFQPYSRVNYLVQREGELDNDPLGETSTYLVESEGRGGLQQLRAGLGYRINPRFSAGASVDVVFGRFEDARNTRFTGGPDDTYFAYNTRLAGVSGTLGTQMDLPRLLGEEDLFQAGVAVTLPMRLTGDQVLTLGESLDRDTLTTVSGQRERDVALTLPLSARGGVAYQPDDRWTLVADALYEPWGGVSIGGNPAGPRFATRGAGLSRFVYSDRVRASVGMEFVPSGGDRVLSYFQRMGYRLGAYVDDGYVEHAVSGERLRTLGLTAGLSFPALLPGTRVDLLGEVGTQGTTDQNLVRDTFFRIAIGVNFGERWFQERRLQ